MKLRAIPLFLLSIVSVEGGWMSCSGSTVLASQQSAPTIKSRTYKLTDSGILPPRFIHREDPTPVEDAQGKKLSGQVILELVVDEQGLPTQIKVVQGIGGLDKAAIEVAKRFEFQPGTKDGLPVKVKIDVQVQFRPTN